jgi:hypothetical protein
MVADHRGIFGLGLLLTLGMAATLTAALVVLPVLLQWSQPPRPASLSPGDSMRRRVAVEARPE